VTSLAIGPRRASARVAEEDWRPIGIQELEAAADAALRDHGCTAVTAGPGAGKTEFLAQRAAFLLQTGRSPWPSRILSISYKRDSAAVLRRRVAERVPEHADRFVSVTFDAFTKGLLDRFRAALPTVWRLHQDYEITFWTEREVRDFLTALAAHTIDPAVRAELYRVQPAVLRNLLRRARLPAAPGDKPRTAEDLAARSWWDEHYRSPSPQRVDFGMLNRLVILLLEQRPQILHALRSTYPFVFVDEFQDTTPAQLELLSVAFPAPAVVTAVGDFKQRIMGFAGAHQSAIGAFISDFDATPYELTWNFRSTPALVDLQHIIAQALDPAVSKGVSKVTAEDGHVPACLWTYDDIHTQAQHLAGWIAADIAASERQPSDFVFVARQKVADLEAVLAPALVTYGIRLRNDDVRHGELTLQDPVELVQRRGRCPVLEEPEHQGARDRCGRHREREERQDDGEQAWSPAAGHVLVSPCLLVNRTRARERDHEPIALFRRCASNHDFEGRVSASRGEGPSPCPAEVPRLRDSRPATPSATMDTAATYRNALRPRRSELRGAHAERR
jgi:DNA helicase-2/ATP-dependent DNA helicase PcrA